MITSVELIIIRVMGVKIGKVYSVSSVGRRANEYSLSHRQHSGMTESIYSILEQSRTHAISISEHLVTIAFFYIKSSNTFPCILFILSRRRNSIAIIRFSLIILWF